MSKWLRDQTFKHYMMKLLIMTHLLLVGIGTLVIYDRYGDIKEQRKIDQEQNYENFKRIEEEYCRRYTAITNDLLYLSQAAELLQYIGIPTSVHYDYLVQEWLVFFNYHPIYDQIRYLDETGKEVVRINYEQGVGKLVPVEELQDKGGRYYFVEAMNVPKNTVYISRIDLNVENRQIEEPIKPMMRFGTPVYGEDGSPKGIVMFNYYAQRLLNQLDILQKMFRANLQVLNDKGYWVYHGDEPEKCWGFMYGDLERNLGYIMPELMREIKNSNGEAGTYYPEDGGVYYYKKMFNEEVDRALTPNQDKYLILLTHLPRDVEAYNAPASWKSACMTFFQNYKIQMLLTWGVLLMISILLAYIMTARRKQKVLESTMDHYYKVILHIVEFMENDESLDEGLTSHDFDRIQIVAQEIAIKMGIEKEKIEEIRKYAAIHDIGKIGVDRSILQKPGKLTEEEMKQVQQHVTIGGKLVEKVMGKDNQVVSNIVRYHHEAWDGSGYETHIKGDWIPIEARIIAIVDIYDALRSKRPYKKAFSHEEAMEIIEKMKGTKLDPEVVTIFEALGDMIKTLYEED